MPTERSFRIVLWYRYRKRRIFDHWTGTDWQDLKRQTGRTARTFWWGGRNSKIQKTKSDCTKKVREWERQSGPCKRYFVGTGTPGGTVTAAVGKGKNLFKKEEWAERLWCQHVSHGNRENRIRAAWSRGKIQNCRGTAERKHGCKGKDPPGIWPFGRKHHGNGRKDQCNPGKY